MKKIELLLLFIGITCCVWGQGDHHSKASLYQSQEPTEEVASDLTFSDLPQLLEEEERKENRIKNLVEIYYSDSSKESHLLLPQLKALLFEVLDLKIQQAELKIKFLREELSIMQTDTLYREKTTEIERLKSAISKVEESLQFRKAHRVAIVLNRLKDLGLTKEASE